MLPASAKVSSLYAIDALARAARSRATKKKLTGDMTTVPGNCATFLLKLDGILDGVFQDVVTSAGSEGKVSGASHTDLVDLRCSRLVMSIAESVCRQLPDVVGRKKVGGFRPGCISLRLLVVSNR